MKIHIKSTHRPVLVTTPSRSKTLIVGGKITHVNGEEWEPAYVAIMPGGRITLDDIEWEYAWEKKSLTPPAGMKTAHYPPPGEWKVKGSKGNVYTVREVGDNMYTCDCDGFKYRRNCRHIYEI